MNSLTVVDGGREYALSYEEAVKFHGGAYPAGTALGWRLLEAVSEGGSKKLQRGGWTFYTGIGMNGPGIIDTVDYCLRVRRDGCLLTDPALCDKAKAPAAPGEGKYFFFFEKGDCRWEIVLRDGILAPSFLSLSKKRHEEGPAFREMEQLFLLRKKMEDEILLLPPKELLKVERSVKRAKEV